MAKHTFKVGDQVWWRDPDEGICSQWATIQRIEGTQYLLKGLTGGSIGAFHNEIYREPPELKMYSVDIQVTEESTYQIAAISQDDAEEIAMRMYGDSETPNHEETFDAKVTNCEEI